MDPERWTGHRPHASPRRSRRSAAGRICSFPDCETLLSIYNASDRCWKHREMKVPRLRGRTG